VIILGEEELKRDRAILRNMATKEQEEIPLEEIVVKIVSSFRLRVTS
ncbi:MAG: hypothetical protein HY882_07505, partial [Deltaproteobacteria bacterium]|nr:hypothetical protein [Deltaproteobacteria bacterium]